MKNKTPDRIPLIIVLTLIFPLSLLSQNYHDTLDAKLKTLYEKDGFPGFSVAIVNKNGIIYEHGAGYANIKSKIPFTAQTIENLGSVSKLFVAAALMKGIEDGFFTLETDINTILPFKVENPYYGEAIKIKDLVTHTSTIKDVAHIYHKSYRLIHRNNTHYPFYKYWLLKLSSGNRSDTTLKSFLAAYCSKEGKWYSRKIFAKAHPGDMYSYSNIGAALAAYLVEIKSGISFAEYCTRKILIPLQMDHSSWQYPKSGAGVVASRYDHHGKVFPDYALVTYPDGGLYSSVSDASRFLTEMIKGSMGQGTLLTKESYSKLFAPAFMPGRSPAGIDTANEANRGVFWILYNDGRIGHDGNDPGISTYLYFRPSTGLGYLFFTNIMDDTEKLFSQDQRILKVMEKYGALLNKQQ